MQATALSDSFQKKKKVAQISFCLTEWCCVKSDKLSAIEGRPVTIQCPYPSQHRDNRKFLCKGDHRKNCTDMETSHSRFTLQDNVTSSSFLVTITELNAGDAGTYWCGSDTQWSVGNYTKIKLSVGKIMKRATDGEYNSMHDIKNQNVASRFNRRCMNVVSCGFSQRKSVSHHHDLIDLIPPPFWIV